MAKSSKNRVEFPIPVEVSEELTRIVINHDVDLTENIAYRVENLTGMCHLLSHSSVCEYTAQSLQVIKNELNVIQALIYGITDIEADES